MSKFVKVIGIEAPIIKPPFYLTSCHRYPNRQFNVKAYGYKNFNKVQANGVTMQLDHNYIFCNCPKDCPSREWCDEFIICQLESGEKLDGEILDTLNGKLEKIKNKQAALKEALGVVSPSKYNEYKARRIMGYDKEG